MERDLRPLCAVCGRKVDLLEVWYDPIQQGWTYAAHCHGSSERVSIDDRDLVNGRITLSPGRAFAAKALGHQAAAAPEDGWPPP